MSIPLGHHTQPTRGTLTRTSLAHSPNWVSAPPFVSHVRWLLTHSELPWRVLAVAAQVPAPVVRALAVGGPRTRRIREVDAARLFAWTPNRLIAAGNAHVKADATICLLGLLHQAGFSDAELATFLDCDEFAAHAMRTDDVEECLRSWQWRAVAAAEAHHLIECNYERVPLARWAA